MSYTPGPWHIATQEAAMFLAGAVMGMVIKAATSRKKRAAETQRRLDRAISGKDKEAGDCC